MGDAAISRRDRAREDFRQQLTEDFVWGALAPGATVDVAGICWMYGVDETLAREGLDGLVEAGMAQRQPANETCIAPLTLQVSRILIERCRGLSLQAVDEAVEHLEEIDATEMHKLLEQMGPAAAGDDRILLADLVRKFHAPVYAASHDTRLLEDIDGTNPLLARLMALVMVGRGQRMIDRLELIARAVEKRDGEGVATAYVRLWDKMAVAVDGLPPTAWPR